jgi:hypothetical protein
MGDVTFNIYFDVHHDKVKASTKSIYFRDRQHYDQKKDRQHYDQKKKDRQYYDQEKDRQHYDQKKDRQYYGCYI